MAPTVLTTLVLPLLLACSAPGDPTAPPRPATDAAVGEASVVLLPGEDRPADDDAALTALARDSAPPRAAASVRSPTRADSERLTLLTDSAHALSSEDPQTAYDLATRALELDDASTLGLFLQGVALLDLGRLDESAASLARAAELDPGDPSTLSVLARVQYERGALGPAVEILGRVVELEPDQARHWTSLGLMELEAGHWDRSYDAFLQAVTLDPSDAEAHHGLGRLYSAAGEYDMAERAFRTALEARPGDPGLEVALGHVLRDLDRGDEAVECYRRAQHADPKNPWIAANLGSALLELHRLPEARRQFERALSVMDGPAWDHALVLQNYGEALDGLGDLDGARLAYEEAIETEPTLGRAHALLGLLDLDAGRDDDARTELDAAYALAALDPQAVVRLVLLHEQHGAWDLARDRAQSVLDGDASDPKVALAQAQILLRARGPALHDTERGVALLTGLLAGRLRADAAGWLLMAETHEQEGHLDAALDVLDEALAAVASEGPATQELARERARVAARLGR